MSGNIPQPEEIEEFLGSFKPSLAHLVPGFMEVGIINRSWLLVVSRWERDHVQSFFSSRYHDVKKGLAPLPAVVVEALVVRFKDERSFVHKLHLLLVLTLLDVAAIAELAALTI
ncbi:hypothetical protein B0H12DRAFT_1242145 [Mycena haematopus]|nr:hypothetical protein B0H12DRAFT_1242145 [Mycena haematopus]